MYTNWKVNDIVSIGAKIEDFCGMYGDKFLFLDSYDMEKYPTPLNIVCHRPNCSYYCLDTRNREVVFYSCMNYHVYSDDVNCANRSIDKYYRELGRVRSNENGIASFNHQISEQDRADYNDAISLGGVYNIVSCINDIQASVGHAAYFGIITVSPYIPITPTHYIEYNLNYLPIDFINWVSSQIATISDKLGRYIPLPVGILYSHTEFVESKFRIYVVATSTSSMGSMDYNWYSLNTIQTLTGIAKTIAGILLFILAGLVAGITGGLALPVIIAVLGAGVIAWGIYDITTGGTTSGGTAEPSADQKLKIVKDFVENYLSPDCDIAYPACATTPPTCDRNAMRAYLSCVNNARYAQCQHAKAVAGLPISECDAVKVEKDAEDSCLVDGTCTPEEAKNRSNTIIVNPVKEIVERTIEIVTCDPGYRYNKDTKKCDRVCNIPVLGYCADDIVIFGGLLLGGLVIFKFATRR